MNPAVKFPEKFLLALKWVARAQIMFFSILRKLYFAGSKLKEFFFFVKLYAKILSPSPIAGVFGHKYLWKASVDNLTFFGMEIVTKEG